MRIYSDYMNFKAQLKFLKYRIKIQQNSYINVSVRHCLNSVQTTCIGGAIYAKMLSICTSETNSRRAAFSQCSVLHSLLSKTKNIED